MTSPESHETHVEVRPGSNSRLARQAGAVYLAFVAVFASSSFLQGKPLVEGDAAATAKNLLQWEMIFRVGFMSEIVSAFLFLWAAWMLQALFRKVGRDLALLMVLLNLAGVAAECASAMARFGALQCLIHTDALRGLNPDQLQAVAMILLRVSGCGNLVCSLFYAVWLFPFAQLVLKSRYLPRIWGFLLIADGVSLLICFVQLCLFPGFQKWTYPLYPIMFVAEVGTALWLLIKGVKEPESIPG